jgi:hypothetical protein
MSFKYNHNMNNTTLDKKDDFWFNDITVLYKNDNYILFFPQAGTSKIEQLNSIARFSLYLFALLLLFGDPNNTFWLYIPLFLLFSTIILWKLVDKNIINIDNTDKGTYVEINPEENKILNQGGDTAMFNNASSLPNKKCRKPTENNPFMNVLLSDYDEKNPEAINTGPACDLNNQAISDQANEQFNKNLFRDVNDLYEKENSQRTYYSTPSTTIPNDQKSFAEWCYGVPETCKTNQQKCLVFDDLRYARRESPYEYVL